MCKYIIIPIGHSTIMVVHTITIVYGGIITWGDLIRLGYVTEEDVWWRMHGKLDKFPELICLPLMAHDIVEELETSNPERLPPSYRAIIDKKDEEEMEAILEQDRNPYLLFCIGVKCGTISFGSEPNQYPSLGEIQDAEEEFIRDKERTRKLAEVCGKIDLHFIPDDCACCS